MAEERPPGTTRNSTVRRCSGCYRRMGSTTATWKDWAVAAIPGSGFPHRIPTGEVGHSEHVRRKADLDHYAAQIAEADRQGLDGFDSERTSKSDANNKKQATRNGFEWYNKLESARKAGVAGVAAIGLLLGMAGTPAGAAVQGARALPRYNVEAACAQAAGGARAREQSPNWVQAFNACLEPEQQAYDFLQYAWPETDPRTQQVCLSSGPTYGGRIVFTYGTYQRLANCVWQRRNDGAAHHFMQ